jgi:hypothetical protein
MSPKPDTIPTFVVARVLNRHGDLDYLIGLDAKHGTSASLAMDRAATFTDRASAAIFMEQAQKAVPTWLSNHNPPPAIEYRIVDGPALDPEKAARAAGYYLKLFPGNPTRWYWKTEEAVAFKGEETAAAAWRRACEDAGIVKAEG